VEFCPISPVAGLERYCILSKTHLLLAQIRDPRYWEFYIKRREVGDFIILDNGAYEGELNRSRLIECINLVKPHVVALPDRLGEDWKSSHHSSMNFLDCYDHEFEDTLWMYIPQAEPGDIIGFVESLFRALDDPRISFIGLPRALTYSITNDVSMRVRMAEQIRKRNSRVQIHALGMVKGSVRELIQLAATNCVRSIDSNAPVWRGWCGYQLSAPWPEISVRYDDPNLPSEVFYNYAQSKHELILLNLEECGVNTNVYSRPRNST
jgi:hypothetical protein